MSRLIIAVLAICLCRTTVAAPVIAALVNSAHGANQLVADFKMLKSPSLVGTSVILDRTTCSPGDTTSYPNFFGAAAAATTAQFFPVVDGNDCGPPIRGAENYVPYGVLNYSFTRGPTEDVYYAQFARYDQVASLPYLGGCTLTDICKQPGIYAVETASQNQYGLSPSASGVEFEFSASYKGFDTSAASWVTAGMSAVLTALRYDHPTWTVPDIVAALRQTAANWSSGYSATNYGYGIVDYDRADAIASASSLYLQPPVMDIINFGDYAAIVLYPFRQTRRAYEVLYSVTPSYVWPVKNEYTTADITASRAKLLYTSNGTDITPTFSYTPVAHGRTVTLVAFTTDGKGHCSRVESFSSQWITPTAGAARPQPAPLSPYAKPARASAMALHASRSAASARLKPR